MIIEELNRYAIGSDDWINILNVEYSSESWKKHGKINKEERNWQKVGHLRHWLFMLIKEKRKKLLIYYIQMLFNTMTKWMHSGMLFFNALNVRYINPDLVKQFEMHMKLKHILILF